ncbi:DNA-binding response regulator [Coprococcus sp. AF19-8AC]|jgi:two-component system copper resistance phosphate regulon response regulator CusR|uniref:response regulator transcription factor n=1 Tax=Coprococcus sp. AF19-8AC TaxID=2293090 RepID=UPI000E773044|nr:response regulator transcription factor [Coprococcus sp. AF19-8AC]RJV43986.1 DNA-binding response regulator [Coprococcus sp. AF19-8AC]
MRILVVEDEKDLNSIICSKLVKEGYNVDACYDGQAALDYMEAENYDGAIMDIMIPNKDGITVLREMRNAGIQVPVLFLTAKTETQDIVRGLDAGASDYMTKPFEFSELMARLRVMLRTQNQVNENVITCGSLVVDMNNRQAIRDGKVIDLTVREYAILEYLARNRNVVVTREQIRVNIWNIDDDVNSNVIDVYIRYLRRKIDDNYEEKLIHTIRGVGYKLEC